MLVGTMRVVHAAHSFRALRALRLSRHAPQEVHERHACHGGIAPGGAHLLTMQQEHVQLQMGTCSMYNAPPVHGASCLSQEHSTEKSALSASSSWSMGAHDKEHDAFVKQGVQPHGNWMGVQPEQLAGGLGAPRQGSCALHARNIHRQQGPHT